ncbi:hypothetical protein FX982_01253 [Pseudomonas graminis]|uniref:Uncharacterized protein n=1 Tax=Pseudomonas graminis TaxID=158627 RepID=A0A6M8MEQ5_9PSED|nr:hypothetical protein FX982_01253 [Pseudomonas graminis]
MLTKAAFQTLKIWWMYRPLRDQARSHECMSAAADCMPNTALVGVSLLTKAAFQTLKIWWMHRPLREQARSHACMSAAAGSMPNTAPCRSELAREGSISNAEVIAAAVASSRASSLPQFDLQHAQLVSVWSIQELPAEAGSYQAEVFRFYRFDIGKVCCVDIRYAVRDSLDLAHLGFQVAAQCLLKVISPITPVVPANWSSVCTVSSSAWNDRTVDDMRSPGA